MTSRLPLPDGITSFTAAGRRFQPKVTDALATFEAAAARLPHLGPVLMELVRLRCARTHDCAICKSLRIDAAQEAGVTEELAAQLDDYERGPFDERTKIALRFVDTYLTHPGTLDAAVRDQLLGEFSTAEIATLVLQVMKWSTQKMVVTLGMDRKPGMDPTGRTLLSLNFDETGAAVVGARRGPVQPRRSVRRTTVGNPST